MEPYIFAVAVNNVCPTAEGTRVPSNTLSHLEKIHDGLQEFSMHLGITIEGEVDFSPAGGFLRAERDGLEAIHPLAPNNVQTTAHALRETFDECLDRYERACLTNEPSTKKSFDVSVLKLNNALWKHAGIGASISIFTGEDFATTLVARDPQTLRFVKPDEHEDVLIKCRLVTGSRWASGVAYDMFPNLGIEVNAILSVAGDIPEVLCSMSAIEAQEAFKGLQLMTAHVRCRKGQIPEVIGSPHFDVG